MATEDGMHEPLLSQKALELKVDDFVGTVQFRRVLNHLK
jgi:hypothetical protein